MHAPWAQDVCAIHLIQMVIHVCAVSSPWSSLSTSCCTFRSFFLFLNCMKSMVNLHNSCNEGVDASDDLLLSTGKGSWHQQAKTPKRDRNGRRNLYTTSSGPQLTVEELGFTWLTDEADAAWNRRPWRDWSRNPASFQH